MRWVLIGLSMMGLIFLSGCAAALLGGGVVGGLIISDDSVEHIFSASVDDVWRTALEYLQDTGEIVKIDKDEGIIYAEKVFGKYYVQIMVEGKPSGTKTVIKARKRIKLIPDVDTAVKIMTALMKELE